MLVHALFYVSLLASYQAADNFTPREAACAGVLRQASAVPPSFKVIEATEVHSARGFYSKVDVIYEAMNPLGITVRNTAECRFRSEDDDAPSEVDIAGLKLENPRRYYDLHIRAFNPKR